MTLFAECVRQITLPSFYGGAYEPTPRQELAAADAKREALIIKAILSTGYPITRKEICAETGMTAAVASRMLTNMNTAGKLICHGRRSLARWAVA